MQLSQARSHAWWIECYEEWRAKLGWSAKGEQCLEGHSAPDLCTVCGRCFDHCRSAKHLLETGVLVKYFT